MPDSNFTRYVIGSVAPAARSAEDCFRNPKYRLRSLAVARTWDATPTPKLVVAVGDCGCDGGIFGTSYATCGPVASVLRVDVAVPGCPPAPIEILRGILTAVRRGRTPASKPK